MNNIEIIESVPIHIIESVAVVNTTPHSINFKSERTGEEYEVAPCGTLLNAKPEEEYVSGATVQMVRTVFKATDEGQEFIDSIPETVVVADIEFDVVIVGSMIAAKAYDRCVAMTPTKGFERVPPAQKKMNLYKFAVG